ncbi:14376_t:CDS:2, partial [Dentiscutata erythropus]
MSLKSTLQNLLPLITIKFYEEDPPEEPKIDFWEILMQKCKTPTLPAPPPQLPKLPTRVPPPPPKRMKMETSAIHSSSSQYLSIIT